MDAAAVVVPTVRVKAFVAKKAKGAAAQLVSACTGPKVYAYAGGVSVFGGYLVLDFLQRLSMDAAAVVVPTVCVQAFVAKKAKGAAAQLVSACPGPKVYASAGGASVFGGKLVRDYLDLSDSFKRRLKPVPRRTVV